MNRVLLMLESGWREKRIPARRAFDARGTATGQVALDNYQLHKGRIYTSLFTQNKGAIIPGRLTRQENSWPTQ